MLGNAFKILSKEIDIKGKKNPISGRSLKLKILYNNDSSARRLQIDLENLKKIRFL